jgi:TRAP transporter TAXI family solute receptor
MSPTPDTRPRAWLQGWTRGLITLREAVVSFAPLVLLVGSALVLAYWWLAPTPPKHVVLATGPEQSAYDQFGQRYAQALAPLGIEVTLRPTSGAQDNLNLLRSGEVDLGFVQGGSISLTPTDTQAITSLGSLFVEPVWVFYTSAQPWTRLQQLKGKRVNVGTVGSGVPNLFNALLDANHMAASDMTLSTLDETPATIALINKQVDAIVFVSAPESLLVRMLLQTPDVRLMPFAQANAYSRQMPYLAPVALPSGVVDLAALIPSTDVPLVATTTSLLAQADTHPALLQLFSQAAARIHGGAGWFNNAGTYPNAAQSELPVADEALRTMRGGTPFLQRYVPFWLANVIERMWLAMSAIVVLALPLSRVVPPLYTLRIRSRVFRWYSELRDIEAQAARGVPTAQLLAQMNALEANVAQVQVPLSYTDELYALRQHIAWTRSKLQA